MDKTLENVLKILTAGGSLVAGAFLTALRAQLATAKKKSWLYWIFYTLAVVVILASLIIGYSFREEIFPGNGYAIAVLLISCIFSLLLILITYRSTRIKNHYTLEQLNPVVNEFSTHAEKNNIKLLAGNLDFLGKSVSEIDQHPQFTCLKLANFREIQILCTKPVTNEDKIRYGKIVTDLPTTQLKYYRPLKADLRVRGRIKTLNNVTRLLIYSKVAPGKYQALELNTAENDGALYSHLWNLIWELADAPNGEQIAEYCRLYRG